MPPGHVERFLHAVHPLLDKYGYQAVFVLIFLENFGCPVPGEVIFIAAILATVRGNLQIVPVVLCAWLASVCGGMVGFAIGRFGGRRLLENYGRYIGINAVRLKKAETFFARYGGMVVVAARYFEGFRQVFAILAGSIATSWRSFLLYNALGAALWVGTWAALVLWFGRHMRRIWERFREHEVYVIVALSLACAIAAYILHWRRMRARRASATEPPPPPQALQE